MHQRYNLRESFAFYCDLTWFEINHETDQQISQKLELDLMVYSATSLAKDDDLSSSNVLGESYSSISPTAIDKKNSENETRN